MDFDFKKEFKEFYVPSAEPAIVDIPPMNFTAVRGKGDPNAEVGEYKEAMAILFGITFTLKMSYKGSYKIEGFFKYVAPPLEGLWWMADGLKGVDYSRKSDFQWISMIRLPDFVKQQDFEWAREQATRKKGGDFSKAEFLRYNEGLCVQCLHLGRYDDEPATVARMDAFAKAGGYAIDITDSRHHHEIYLSDPRKSAGEKLRTVVRHPIRKI